MRVFEEYLVVNTVARSVGKKLCHITLSYNLRDSENKLTLPLPRANYYRNSFCYSGAVLTNNLPTDVRQAKSLAGFLKLLTSSSNTAFMENRL